jgi:hypothetical protein
LTLTVALTVALTAALTPALTACQDDAGQVASLASPAPSASNRAPEPVSLAETLAVCLTEAGLPARAERRDDGQFEVTLETDEPYFGCFDAWGGRCVHGSGNQPEGVAKTNLAAMEEYRKNPEGDFLVVGQEDHAEAFAGCLAETGYTPPEVTVDSEEELAQKRAIVEVTLKWANCARSEGLAVTDPAAPVADNWETTPAALIPPSTPADQLRSVLGACPNFDQAAHAADAAAQLEPDYDPSRAVVDPVIQIDAPVWREGQLPEAGAAEWTEEGQALWDALTAANRAFWDGQGGVG